MEEQQRAARVLQLAGTADASQESGGSSFFAALDKASDARHQTWGPLADLFFDEEAVEADGREDVPNLSRARQLDDSFDPNVSTNNKSSMRTA